MNAKAAPRQATLPRVFDVPIRGLTGAAAARLPATTRASIAGNPDGPLLVVLGGISATASIAYEPDGAPGWWHGIFGEDGAVGTKNYRILGIDFLADESGRFAPTSAEQAVIVDSALAVLGEEEAAAIIGASYGGMVALAFAERFQPRTTRLVVISAGAAPHPMATAARSLQRDVVALGAAGGDPAAGLALARAMAMLTYRTRAEFGTRFTGGISGEDPLSDSEPHAYLRARGIAYLENMTPGRFLSLSASIDRHAISPGKIAAPALVIGVEDDQVVPVGQAIALSEQLGGPRQLHVVRSIFGHDAFLKETAEIGALIANFLENPS